ncbi:MAG: DUF885 domain-containing protein [Myxococcota bacterium]
MLQYMSGVALLSALVACRPSTAADTGSSRPAASDPAVVATASPAHEAEVESAATGVTNAVLAAVLRDHWAYHLEQSPTTATRLGVHDYDDRLDDRSKDARARYRKNRASFLARVLEIDVASLSESDRITHALFVDKLQREAKNEVCRDREWNIHVHQNPVGEALGLHEGFVLETPQDGANLVARYRAVGPLVDQELEALERGAADGLVANARSLSRLLELIEGRLAEPVEQWSMLEPIVRLPTEWPEDDRRRIAGELRNALTEVVHPAFVRYRDFVRDRLLPIARGPEAPGLGALALGRRCYEAKIHEYTTMPFSAVEVHDIGLDEIAKLDEEIAALGRTALGTQSLAETVARLREDPTLYFADSDEVEAAAVKGLALAKEAMPGFFGILPRADCVVRRVPGHSAPQTHIGYYNPPHTDGSKPGEYFINVYAPTTRPRFEARVLAVHESIPGHHLQIAISQELAALPAFRRHSGYGAYVEGWALYTERLAEEMGLYEDDLDRMGMLSFDAWRAARLVVDTGIHAKGWTRAQAEAFMLEHTALTPTNIENEVDRYIGWPGQALGYKIGQLQIWEMRRAAEAALGERFELAEFHDVVLGGGPLPLPVLRERVDAWIARGPGTQSRPALAH